MAAPASNATVRGLNAIGSMELLDRPCLGFFCSIRCPGDLILQSLDFAMEWRDDRFPVAGGFHSPIEREVLRILLRAAQPVVLCPARGLTGMRVRREFRQPLEEGRLLIASPFPASVRRPTVDLAEQRNRFVTSLVQAVLLGYAEPGGKLQALARAFSTSTKAVFAFGHPRNASILEMGAVPVGARSVLATFERAVSGAQAATLRGDT